MVWGSVRLCAGGCKLLPELQHRGELRGHRRVMQGSGQLLVPCFLDA